MKELTREWVLKAEGDFATAQREFRVRKGPNYDAVCFHAQQCVEKYFKARLQEAGKTFGRIHDLTILLDSVLELEPLWSPLRPALRSLNTSAVEVRYPGESADKELAADAMKTCRLVRRMVRESLRLRSGSGGHSSN